MLLLNCFMSKFAWYRRYAVIEKARGGGGLYSVSFADGGNICKYLPVVIVTYEYTKVSIT